MNKKERRIKELSAILKEQPMLSINKLSELLHVSEMTIRRDLKYLDEIKEDGARLHKRMSDSESEYDASLEETKNYIEKDRIAKFAATLIDPGDIIVIDSGTSAAAMAKYVPENMGLTIIGYNFTVLSRLHNKKDVALIFSGGYYHGNDQMFESPEGIEMIKAHRANKLFLSASGVHETLGITCTHSYEVQTKRAAIGSSLEKILLVDSSKFGVVRTPYFAQLDEIDVIITDSKISPEWIQFIKDKGIKLYVV